MNKPLSEQLRTVIEASGITRYRLAKASGVDAGQLCRFMQGKVQLTFETLDRIGEVLGLRMIVDEPTTPSPPSSPKNRAKPTPTKRSKSVKQKSKTVINTKKSK